MASVMNVILAVMQPVGCTARPSEIALGLHKLRLETRFETHSLDWSGSSQTLIIPPTHPGLLFTMFLFMKHQTKQKHSFRYSVLIAVFFHEMITVFLHESPVLFYKQADMDKNTIHSCGSSVSTDSIVTTGSSAMGLRWCNVLKTHSCTHTHKHTSTHREHSGSRGHRGSGLIGA